MMDEVVVEYLYHDEERAKEKVVFIYDYTNARI